MGLLQIIYIHSFIVFVIVLDYSKLKFTHVDGGQAEGLVCADRVATVAKMYTILVHDIIQVSYVTYHLKVSIQLM